MIDAWKVPDQVEYTRAGNQNPPSIKIVVRWVENAWEAVPDSVIHKSILIIGFAYSYEDWNICHHDVDATLFRE